MKWNIPGDFNKYLTDKSLKIVDSHLRKVCKRSEGPIACRYLACTVSNGFVCVKNTPLKVYVDREANGNPKWKAKGDNCDGLITHGKTQNHSQDATSNGIAEAPRKENNPPTKKNRTRGFQPKRGSGH